MRSQGLTALAATVTAVHALNTGVGKLPSMGYDTFNAFACDYNATSVMAQVKAMKDHGLVDAGYKIFILDDCYTELERNAYGYMVENRTMFPKGLAALNAEMNGYGMNLAAYGDLGYRTCAGYPGSWGHEAQDLETWHSWGMSYLKLDHCYFPTDNVSQQNIYGLYLPMYNAISEFAKCKNTTWEFSICEWGLEQPWVWGKKLAQFWRINNDIKPWWTSIATVMNMASYQYWATDFYGHNDMDIMEVGNTGKGNPPGNLTYDESKAHFTAWALLKSPLIIGTDLTTASNETFDILGNRDLIKINQDPNVGESISPFRWSNNTFDNGNPNFPAIYWPSNPYSPAEYWSGNTTWGTVFMILNTADTRQNMSFSLSESWLIRPGRQYQLYDLWEHKDIGIHQAIGNVTLEIPAHGVSAFLANDAGPEPASLHGTCALQFQCSWPNGTLVYAGPH